MIGAIIGDIVGSVYEFANIKTKDFPLFGPRSRFTDDTVCTVAVAQSILEPADPAAMLQSWGRRYPHAGYGHGFFQWICAEHPQPYRSFGNGAAMRVSPAAFLAQSPAHARTLARRVTEVTHNHPEGIKGARATVDAIWMALDGAAPATIRDHVATEYGYDLSRTVDAIRPGYHYDITCQGTVPEAITCALEADSFEDAIRNAISIGGDSDTIGAITGAIAEARFGVPDALAVEAYRRLPDDMRAVMQQMYREAAV